MTKPEYETALDAACREYERLLAERAGLDARLSKLHDTITSLTRLCGYEPTVPWGLTDAIRIVLQRAEAPMTPTDVRERLRTYGFDLDKYASDLSAIHTVLKRLQRAGQVQRVPRKDGTSAYRTARVGTVVLDPHTFIPGRKK